jgi:alkyl sulfatase BDS1-like metallo-beta-lactamase superfamily hydrolase
MKNYQCLATLTVSLLLFACSPANDAQAPSIKPAADFTSTSQQTVHPTLHSHSQEFEKRVYPLAKGVYIAVGYGLANSIMIEGDDGIVIVDVMESLENAQAVMKEFRKITSKPVKALIYTHNHADHILGGRGFVPEGEVDIYAHESTNYYIDRIINQIRPIISSRSTRMFGNLLPKGEKGLVNLGVGPQLDAGQGGGTPTLLRPNKTYSDTLDLDIAGIKIQLIHAPGETNDQTMVWLPEQKVLMPGDTVYKAFPNLYTIRGTLYRDVMDWVRSLDKMRALNPQFIAPGHTRPIVGQQKIQDVLTHYRDAIQYVHDQTLYGMNQGLTPDQLVESITLPTHLKDHPYLQELYGTVEWGVRGIFSGYLGWFDGDTASLSTVTIKQRAQNLVKLAGGIDAFKLQVTIAMNEQNYKWAAELVTHLLVLTPDDESLKNIKAAALRKLGFNSISPNGRNFYLTQALELEGRAVIEKEKVTDASVALAKTFPVKNFISAMPTLLVPKRSQGMFKTMSWHFPDVNKSYTLEVRSGVAEFREGLDARADVKIKVNKDDWIEIILGQKSFSLAIATGTVSLNGGIKKLPELSRFFAMFDLPNQ